MRTDFTVTEIAIPIPNVYVDFVSL